MSSFLKKSFSDATNNSEKTTEEQQQTPEQQEEQQTVYDAVTLHGTHYTVADFDAEVQRRAEARIAQEKADGETFSQQDIDSIYWNYARDLYYDWNNPTEDQAMRWSHSNSLKYHGFATSGFVTADASNLLLEPIHGVSLEDYGALCAVLSNGANETATLKAMGIDKAVWDEVNTLWAKRMQEDGTFTVSTLFGDYFIKGAAHPKLQNIGAKVSAAGTDNLEKIKTDRYFYEELAGARQAAYEYGLDGARWIQENFGISLGDFQSVAMQWMTAQNQSGSTQDILHYHNYQQQKQQEYAEKFAKEMGGNVADDVEF